jgi:hypothetical protein
MIRIEQMTTETIRTSKIADRLQGIGKLLLRWGSISRDRKGMIQNIRCRV